MAHMLRELEVVGRDIVLAADPNFSLHSLGRIKALRVTLALAPEEESVAELQVHARVGAEDWLMTLCLTRVRRLVIPEINETASLHEVEIEDVRNRWLEGIRFELSNIDGDGLRCSCGGIEIRSFEKLTAPDGGT